MFIFLDKIIYISEYDNNISNDCIVLSTVTVSFIGLQQNVYHVVWMGHDH
jgi:hypothetical protein